MTGVIARDRWGDATKMTFDKPHGYKVGDEFTWRSPDGHQVEILIVTKVESLKILWGLLVRKEVTPEGITNLLAAATKGFAADGPVTRGRD